MVVDFEPRPKHQVESELTNKFQYFSAKRQAYEEEAIEDYKLYRGYREAHEDLQDDENTFSSSLHIPYAYEVIDTIRSRVVSSFFDSQPYMDFLPQPEGGDAHQMQVSEEKAKVASALVDMQLDKNNIYQLFYDYITSLLIFPAAIMSVGWRYEEKPIKRRVKMPEILRTPQGVQYTGSWYEQIVESVESIWDDNELSLVDFFDFWPDPRGKDIDDCRGAFQRERLTYEELDQMMRFLYDLDEGVIYDVDIESLLGQSAGIEDGANRRLSEIGKGYEAGDAYMTEGPDRGKNMFEVLHYWEDNRHSILLNRSEVIYDGPSPYWRHRMKPFVVESYEPMPNEFYGMSGVRLINHLQQELNTQRNQRIDNVSLVINRMWKVLNSANIDEDELVSRPHGVIYVDNPDDVMPLQMPDVTASSYQEEQITKQDMENTLGAPPVVRGAEAAGDATATEQSIKATGAGVRFEVKIRMFESLGLTRMAKLMDLNNQQFVSGERLVKVGQEEAVQWRVIQTGELIGEFDYSPSGTTLDPAANREIRRQQLSEMMQFLLETGNPYLDIYELTREFINSFDLRNPEKFLIPREVVEQQMAQQQAAEEQAAMEEAMAAQGGGAQQSPVGAGNIPQPDVNPPPHMMQDHGNLMAGVF